MSEAETVAALRALAIEAAGAIRAAGGGRALGAALYVRAVLGDDETPGCLAEPPSRTGGRHGASMVPLPELRAAGWRVLPLPSFRSLAMGAPPRLHWFARDWAAIPPEKSDLRARRFDGRGRAQAWASECYSAGSGCAV
jgi:hypothetical protein